MTTSPEADASSVIIRIPADANYVRVVRLATSGTATAAGFDVDAIDDLRIAVDELCATLIELAEPGSAVSLTMALGDDLLRITGEVTTGVDQSGVDAERHALGRMILAAVTDHHELVVHDGVARFSFDRLRAARTADDR